MKVRNRFVLLAVSVIQMLALVTFPATMNAPLHALSVEATPTVSLVNPGPDGCQENWTAYSQVIRFLGSDQFVFYTNETSLHSTFVVNVTIADVVALKSWGVGIIYDNTSLTYVDMWLPSDHVFKPVEDMGWTLYTPSVLFEDVDSTHRMIAWGCAYAMGDPPWTFSGSGTLCQIEFSIEHTGISQLDFSPDWTSCYYYPSGADVPNMQSGYFQYNWVGPPMIRLVNPGPARYPETGDFEFYINETHVGDTFVVNVTISFVENLYIWQIGLWYDGSALQFDGLILPSDNVFHPGPSIACGATEQFNETHSLVKVGATSYGYGPFTGAGTLCQLVFRIVKDAPAESFLKLDGGRWQLNPQWGDVWWTRDSWTWILIGGGKFLPGLSPNLLEARNAHYTYIRRVFRGDVDGDGNVTMGDVLSLCEAFGSTKGADGYFWHHPPCVVCPHTPYCDIDSNGRIDMTDVVAGLDNFGRHCP